MSINKIVNRNASYPNVNVVAMQIQNLGRMSAVDFKKRHNTLEILDVVNNHNPWIMASKRMKKENHLIGVGRYIKREN